MSLNGGREFLSIPGPSVMPDRVLRAMHRGAPNIYSGDIVDVTDSVHRDLKVLAGTNHDSVMYLGNGHAAWEAALVNVLRRGDTILVLNSGRFAAGWGDMAAALGVHVEVIEAGTRGAVDPAAVEKRLAADDEQRIRAVLVVQIDTASSVWNDIEAIGAAIARSQHPALFMVDCIASFGCVPFHMDAWGVDVMVAACQKGLMTPPGVSFNFFGPRARAAREWADLVTQHWDWRERTAGDVFYKQFGGTPPTHHLYGLREALDMIVHDEGVDAVWARHRQIARAVRACVSRWSDRGAIEFNITDQAHRSDAVTTVLAHGFDADALRDHAESFSGLVLGLGLAGLEGFRIGHMGHVNPPMILGTLAATEVSMRALGVPHLSGVDAAVAELAAS